jgi:UDP-GlcNAc:undecaprenyl-phosphate GlcNAc-1-phosphate transferase
MLGGVGFFAGFALGVLTWIFFGAKLGQSVDGQLMASILATVSLAFVMGLIDDVFNTSPLFKFAMQFAVGIILISCGIYIQMFENQWLNYALTLFWVVGIMNSLNMLDNMDSVTNTMCVIVLAGILVLLLSPAREMFFVILIMSTLASMIAFYRFNWHPSKMYMGDNGSQFLGAFMAIMSIRYLWNPAAAELSNPVYPFLIVYLAFLVPLTDTATVTINRLMRGQSPFVGGTDHTTHHLSYRGLSDRQVVCLLGTINIVSASVAVWFLLMPPKSSWPLWVAGCVALVVSGLLYANTKVTKPKQKSKK